MSNAHYEAVRRYNAQNVKGLYLALNKKTDADIISILEAKDNKQGYIKELIRANG